jgi:hypothetical protein
MMTVQEIYNALLEQQHPDALTHDAFIQELWAQAEREAERENAPSRAQDREADERGVR